jgi:AcrR family transcriptional regulator
MTTTATTNLDGRERVLSEARKLFFTHGYSDVSMREIADAVEMTQAALYYHFRNKEDLYISVAVREIEVFMTGLQEALYAGETFRDRLTSIARFLLEGKHAAVGRLRQDLDQFVRPELREAMDQGAQQIFDVSLPVFQDAIDRGEIGAESVDAAMKIFLGMVLGQVQLKAVGCPVEVPNEQLVPLLVDTYLRGMSPAA